MGVVLMVCGGVMASFGAVLIARGRSGITRSEGAKPGAWTRLGCGLGAFVLGYHMFGWGSPASWVPLKAPVGIWWVVVVGCVVVGLGSWGMDRKDRVLSKGA
ncbi:MAG: hypothetical protein KF902_12985 [Phycisphaeraceae bacterium]|nr:hypothetical protein [Phycisphaeraceae bacterium]